MVVCKLWLAGHMLPDLKPYTRHDSRRGGSAGGEQQQGQQQQQQGLAGQALAALDAADAADTVAERESLPPLAEFVLSSASVASVAGSTSVAGSASADTDAEADALASVLQSVTAGSAAPADIVQLLVESIALNSTANIYKDAEGAQRRCARAAIHAVGPPFLPAVLHTRMHAPHTNKYSSFLYLPFTSIKSPCRQGAAHRQQDRGGAAGPGAAAGRQATRAASHAAPAGAGAPCLCCALCRPTHACYLMLHAVRATDVACSEH